MEWKTCSLMGLVLAAAETLITLRPWHHPSGRNKERHTCTRKVVRQVSKFFIYV